MRRHRIILRQRRHRPYRASQRRRGTKQDQQQAFAVQILSGRFLWLWLPLLAGRIAIHAEAENNKSVLKNKKPQASFGTWGLFQFNPGSDLRSHAVTRAVSSAQRGLTSVFGMGTGVTVAVYPPETCVTRTSRADE